MDQSGNGGHTERLEFERLERAEFERLDALIAELHPRHSATRRTPSLDPDAPRRLAALWRAIGVSEATTPPGPRTSLDAAESRRIMAEIFEEWFDSVRLRDRWGVDPDDHRAAWQRLPARFRVVAAAGPLRDMASVLGEVALTDESADGDDPPVVVIRHDGKPEIRWHHSYVQWQVWTLLRRLVTHRSTGFDSRSGLTGTPVLPSVYPYLEQLAEGVWRLREPGLLRTDSRPADPDQVCYRSPSCYFAYARGLGDDQLGWLRPPGPGRLIVSAGSLDLQGPGYRLVPRQQPAGFRPSVEAIGRLGGADVWLQKYNDDEAVLSCAAEDRETIRHALAGMGERVLRDETKEER
jgi:hypothetical protein